MFLLHFAYACMRGTPPSFHWVGFICRAFFLDRGFCNLMSATQMVTYELSAARFTCSCDQVLTGSRCLWCSGVRCSGVHDVRINTCSCVRVFKCSRCLYGVQPFTSSHASVFMCPVSTKSLVGSSCHGESILADMDRDSFARA